MTAFPRIPQCSECYQSPMCPLLLTWGTTTSVLKWILCWGWGMEVYTYSGKLVLITKRPTLRVFPQHWSFICSYVTFECFPQMPSALFTSLSKVNQSCYFSKTITSCYNLEHMSEITINTLSLPVKFVN